MFFKIGGTQNKEIVINYILQGFMQPARRDALSLILPLYFFQSFMKCFDKEGTYRIFRLRVQYTVYDKYSSVVIYN